MMRTIGFILFALLCGSVQAGEKGGDVDYLGLAAVLIRDGHFERAEAALASLDENSEEFDRARFFTLRGLVHLQRGRAAPAKSDFLKAIAAGQADLVIYLYLAQAHYRLEEYPEALSALDQAGEAAAQVPGVFSMRAQSHWNLGEQTKAWAVLNEAVARFPQNGTFARQSVFYLIEMGLYQEAARTGRDYLKQFKSPGQDSIAIAAAFRQAGQLEQARDLLEAERLRSPENEAVAIELAHVYLKMGKLYSAARVFENAALRKPSLTSEAAELHRRAGNLQRALYLNAQISNSEKKLKQRLAILLELEAYELATAMAGALERSTLAADEDIHYALAYSYFKTGHFHLAESHLQRLRRPELFRKASELRRAMEECSTDRWMCY